MRTALVAVLAAASMACERTPPAGGAAEAPRGQPSALAGAGVPAASWGFGRDATPAEIARLDIDVMPDGRGLPAGRGTVAEGAVVYRTRCAVCHGPEGEGTPVGAALVGRTPGDVFDPAAPSEVAGTRTVGSYWPHATTLFDYIRRAMPFDRPGSLSDEEVYAVAAYLLHRNEIIALDAVMDATTLPAVRMPARDRYVRDDREGTSRVR